MNGKSNILSRYVFLGLEVYVSDKLNNFSLKHFVANVRFDNTVATKCKLPPSE